MPEAVLLEGAHEPVMELLNEETAMTKAVENLMDTFNVGDVFTEDSDIEQAEEGLRSTNVLDKGQNHFVQVYRWHENSLKEFEGAATV